MERCVRAHSVSRGSRPEGKLARLVLWDSAWCPSACESRLFLSPGGEEIRVVIAEVQSFILGPDMVEEGEGGLRMVPVLLGG